MWAGPPPIYWKVVLGGGMWAGPPPMYWKVLLGGGVWAGPSPMYWEVVHVGLATSHVLGGGKCGLGHLPRNGR